jgi:hypothetical protein
MSLANQDVNDFRALMLRLTMQVQAWYFFNEIIISHER